MAGHSSTTSTLLPNTSQPRVAHDVASTMSTSNATNTAPFRLLALPAEMRNRIYGYALHHNQAAGQPGAVNILRACKQIYNESKELLYETSTFSMEITTPFTNYWSPRLLGPSDTTESTSPETARTLTISGDFELCERFKMGTGVPVAAIYDALPAIARKLKCITVTLEAFCFVTVQSFLYALACFLQTPDTKCEELRVTVEMPPNVRMQDVGERYDQVWYPPTKVPSHIKVLLDGVFDPPKFGKAGTISLIQLTFLRGNYPHPEAPPCVKMNTIAEIRRVDALARGCLIVAKQARLQTDSTGVSCGPGQSELCFFLLERLDRLKQIIDQGRTLDDEVAWHSDDSDHVTKCELDLVEAWASLAARDKPMYEEGPEAESELQVRSCKQLRDASGLNKWDAAVMADLNLLIGRLEAKMRERQVNEAAS